MTIVLSVLIFIALMVTLSVVGMRVWVRPKEVMERVSGAVIDPREVAVQHPSLIFGDLLKRLGTSMPTSPKDANIMQRRLIRAGYRGENALTVLYGTKVVFGVLLPILMTMAVASSTADPTNKFLAVVAAAALGFWGPNEWVKIRAQRRQKQIERGLSNALDLLVVCVESGLGLDQAIVQVAKELEHAHPEITEEFALVNLEMKAGKRRVEALRNLAERTGVADLKKLVAVLIQADRFGTGIAASLRGHADYMRVQARQVAEEKAAKLGVKLVFPIFFCILPTLFVVTVGPITVKIIRELIPMMQSIK
jgi:tight adherence protein C